jgi:hypothetical protein
VPTAQTDKRCLALAIGFLTVAAHGAGAAGAARVYQMETDPGKAGLVLYAEGELPALTFGAGCIYLVDWRDTTSYYPGQESFVLGAFSERSGALLWSTNLG